MFLLIYANQGNPWLLLKISEGTFVAFKFTPPPFTKAFFILESGFANSSSLSEMKPSLKRLNEEESLVRGGRLLIYK